MPKSEGAKGHYQKVMPITNKNVGRNLMKTGANAPPYKQGEREMARRRKRMQQSATSETETT